MTTESGNTELSPLRLIRSEPSEALIDARHFGDELTTQDTIDKAKTVELANICDRALRIVSEEVQDHRDNNGLLPTYTTIDAQATARRALVQAINPEGSLATTAFFALQGIFKTAFLEPRPVKEHMIAIGKAGFAGSIAVGVAVTQPLNRLPGVTSARTIAHVLGRNIY